MTAKCGTCGRAKARPHVPRETPEVAASVRRLLVALRKRVGDGGDVAMLPELARIVAEAEGTLADAVTGLRAGNAETGAAGYSWAEVGRELGITRQAAQQRFGRAA